MNTICPTCGVDKDMHEKISDHILLDHIDLMTENSRNKHFVEQAMLLLAQAEPHLSERDFPITFQGRVSKLCTEWFGQVRPYMSILDMYARPPAKPTIDEQIEGQENLIAKLDNPDGLRIGKGILETLRAHKRIMEAKKPEPQNPCSCVPDGDDGTVAHLCDWHKERFGKAYRMQNMAGALTVENIAKLPMDKLRLWIAHGIQESTARKRVEEQLAELQAKHDALVKWLREPTRYWGWCGRRNFTATPRCGKRTL